MSEGDPVELREEMNHRVEYMAAKAKRLGEIFDEIGTLNRYVHEIARFMKAQDADTSARIKLFTKKYGEHYIPLPSRGLLLQRASDSFARQRVKLEREAEALWKSSNELPEAPHG